MLNLLSTTLIDSMLPSSRNRTMSARRPGPVSSPRCWSSESNRPRHSSASRIAWMRSRPTDPSTSVRLEAPAQLKVSRGGEPAGRVNGGPFRSPSCHRSAAGTSPGGPCRRRTAVFPRSRKRGPPRPKSRAGRNSSRLASCEPISRRTLHSRSWA